MQTRNPSTGQRPPTTSWPASNASASALSPQTHKNETDFRIGTLEWLSLPHWDKELGIEPGERQILSAHMPETHLVRAENVELLTQTDLRVWAYRGEIFELSGRASQRQDRLELTAGSGWLPTYASP